MTTKIDNNVTLFMEKTKESNKFYDAQIENIRLKKTIEQLKKEIQKIPKAKKIFEEYKGIVKQKDKKIEELQNENKILESRILKIPYIFRKIFKSE